jgi:hypothetical protein
VRKGPRTLVLNRGWQAVMRRTRCPGRRPWRVLRLPTPNAGHGWGPANSSDHRLEGREGWGRWSIDVRAGSLYAMNGDERQPVFLLWHMHDLGDGETDDKLLGVYSTRDRAERRQRQAIGLTGFAEAPEEFVIAEYAVDQDHWVTGYVSDT